MKRIVIILIGLISVAYGQSQPTSAKTRFVNGLYVGTKLDSYFAAADSNAIYWRADSALMAKYKGTARRVVFSGELAPYKLTADTFFTDGYTTRARLKQYGDSLSYALPYVTPEQYGAVGDGVTNDRDAIQSAINSGKGVFLGSKTYLISDSILLPSNSKLFGMGAKSIIKTNRNKPALVIGGDNIQLSTFWLQGSGADSTLNNGIQVRGTLDEKTDNIIDGLFISGFGNAGIYAVDNPSSVYAANLIVTNTVSSNNEFGFWNAVRAEYTVYSNCVANGNRIGWRNAGGNNSWVGGQLNNNEVGLYLEGGDNNAHSVITGATLNHNTSYSVQGSFVTDGYLISSCMLYFGNILLENSDGIKFSNSEFSTPNFIVGGGSVELISNKFKTTTVFTFDYLGDTAVYRFMDNTFEGTPPTQDTSRFQQIISSSSLTSGGMLKSTTSGAIVNAIAGTDYQAALTDPVTGTGATNSIPKFTSSSTIGNSSITDNGTTVSTSINASVGGVLTVGGTSTDGYLTLSRGANTTYEAATIYRTSGTGNWIVGTRANSTNDFLFFNGTTGSNSLTIASSTGAVTASSSVTASSFIKSGGTSSQALIADGSVQTLTSGIYLPTATNVSNTSAITIDTAQYMRVGSVVTVSGRITFTNTLNSPSQISITLPISTVVSSVGNVAGTGNENVAMKSAIIRGRTGTNDALLEVDGLNSSTYTIYYTYTYRIL